MSILKAKVVFSEIKTFQPGQPIKKLYLVSADVQVSTQKTHLHVDIVDGFVEKKVPTKTFVCEHFFLVLFGDKYLFFNEKGLNTAEKTHDEVGDVIAVGGDYFATRIGDNTLLFHGNGELKGRRPLTDEEKSQLKSAGLL